ncbi:MAG TPA: hypothetical protein VI818_05940, partial [Candidatus Thermoplasmatota archaeon]|nr:hypothetical protein [Candidatus Thermoplasmatota archaeon]
TGGPDIRNVELAAYIDAPRGPRQAWIVRAPTTVAAQVVGQVSSDSPEFFLHFDMDGSNAAPPGSKSPLAFNPGSQLVHVTVFRRGATNSLERVGGNDLLFAYDNARQTLTVSGLSEPFTSIVPDSMFRHFTDLGKDDRILFAHEHVMKNANVSVVYKFTKANATVHWYAFAAHRAPCDTPTGVGAPNCGSVLIYRRLHRTGTTDATGTVTFDALAGDLLRFSTRNFGSAVVVLAASLEPQDPANTALGPEYAAGSPALVTSAAELVLAITDGTSRISKYSIDTRAYENATGGGAPDPVKQAVLNANYLEVQFYADSTSRPEGDAVAVMPDSGAVLASGTIGNHQDPTFSNFRVARLPVTGIQAENTPNFRVFGFLYDTQSFELQSLAWGDRGYTASYALPTTPISENGKAWINLTSVNTNYDPVANEPGFDLKVILRIVIPDLRTNQTITLEIPEGGTVTRTQPVSSSKPGEVKVTFLGTTGDTIKEWKESMLFVNPPAKKSFADRIPGFDGVFAALAVALVGLAMWRRRRTGEGF